MKMDASEIKSSEEIKVKRGGWLNVAGGFYFVTRKCEEGDDFFDIEAEVLSGTVSDREGNRISQRVYKYEKDEEGKVSANLFSLSFATKLLQPKQVRNVDFEKEMPGKVFVAKTWMQKATEKNDKGEWVKKIGDDGKQVEYCRLSFSDMWSPEEAESDDYAKTIPKPERWDGGTADAAAGGNGGGSGSGGGKSSSGDEWDV